MTTPTIAHLIDQVKEAAASDRNKARGREKPVIAAGMEDPIIWTVLFEFDANRYFSDPEFFFEQSLRQKLWRFRNIDDDTPIGPDISAWLGHYPEYTFFGMDLGFSPRGVPLLDTHHPMRGNPDLSLLRPIDFKTSGWMPRAFRWHEDLMRLADGQVNVGFISWGRGCLDLAMQLRGFTNFAMDTFDRPQFVHDLMALLVEERNRWYTACAEHFGTTVGPTWIADDWIYIPYISPAIFRDFVLPGYLEIERHHGAVGGVHSCGDQAPIQQYLLQIKSLGGFEVSAWTSLERTLANIPADRYLQIAPHPNDVLVDSPEQAEAKLQRIAELCDGRSYGVGTAGLTPIYEGRQESEFLYRVNRWLDIARRVLRS